MELETQIAVLGLCYSANIASLIWARFFFFEIKSNVSRKISYVNDPTVAVQIIATYYSLLIVELESDINFFLSSLYVISLILFWWSIQTAGRLSFASGDLSGKLLTTGSYALIRHPFYMSYILIWLASAVLFNSMVLWAAFAILTTVYYLSAKKEEADILAGPMSHEYEEYKKKAGMFWPKLNGLNSQ